MHTQTLLNISLEVILVLNQTSLILKVSTKTYFKRLPKEGTKKERKLINPHNDDTSHGCSHETNHGRGLGRDWPYSKHPRYHGWGVTLKLTFLMFGVNQDDL